MGRVEQIIDADLKSVEPIKPTAPVTSTFIVFPDLKEFFTMSDCSENEHARDVPWPVGPTTETTETTETRITVARSLRPPRTTHVGGQRP